MMSKKEKAKQEKFHRLILAYIYNRMLQVAADGVKTDFFFSCPVFIMCIKIIKTMVRELMQMNLVLALLVNVSQV